MEQIPTTHSRKRSKRRLIDRYRTITTDTEEETEPEGEGVLFFVAQRKEPKEKRVLFRQGCEALTACYTPKSQKGDQENEHSTIETAGTAPWPFASEGRQDAAFLM